MLPATEALTRSTHIQGGFEVPAPLESGGTRTAANGQRRWGECLPFPAVSDIRPHAAPSGPRTCSGAGHLGRTVVRGHLQSVFRCFRSLEPPLRFFKFLLFVFLTPPTSHPRLKDHLTKSWVGSARPTPRCALSDGLWGWGLWGGGSDTWPLTRIHCMDTQALGRRSEKASSFVAY